MSLRMLHETVSVYSCHKEIHSDDYHGLNPPSQKPSFPFNIRQLKTHLTSSFLLAPLLSTNHLLIVPPFHLFLHELRWSNDPRDGKTRTRDHEASTKPDPHDTYWVFWKIVFMNVSHTDTHFSFCNSMNEFLNQKNPIILTPFRRFPQILGFMGSYGVFCKINPMNLLCVGRSNVYEHVQPTFYFPACSVLCL